MQDARTLRNAFALSDASRLTFHHEKLAICHRYRESRYAWRIGRAQLEGLALAHLANALEKAQHGMPMRGHSRYCVPAALSHVLEDRFLALD